MSHTIDRIPFRLENGTPGTAMILIADLPDGRKLVTCANEDEQNDAPVNMVVEALFRAVCQRHRLNPADVVWVEYSPDVMSVGWDGTKVGGWERVIWQGTPGQSPDWKQMTSEDWRGLGAEPPPDPHDLRNPRA